MSIWFLWTLIWVWIPRFCMALLFKRFSISCKEFKKHMDLSSRSYYIWGGSQSTWMCRKRNMQCIQACKVSSSILVWNTASIDEYVLLWQIVVHVCKWVWRSDKDDDDYTDNIYGVGQESVWYICYALFSWWKFCQV